MAHVAEKIEYVKYKGLPYPKKHFRVTVYGANGVRMVANSWDEYQKLVASGLWFDDKKLASQAKQPEEAKATDETAVEEKKKTAKKG